MTIQIENKKQAFFEVNKYDFSKIDRLSFGRSSKLVDIALKGQNISRKHASLVFKDSKINLIDEDSTHGVLVNNEKVKRVQITSGTEFIIGDYKFKILKIDFKEAEPNIEIEKPTSSDKIQKKNFQKKSVKKEKVAKEKIDFDGVVGFPGLVLVPLSLLLEFIGARFKFFEQKKYNAPILNSFLIAFTFTLLAYAIPILIPFVSTKPIHFLALVTLTKTLAAVAICFITAKIGLLFKETYTTSQFFEFYSLFTIPYLFVSISNFTPLISIAHIPIMIICIIMTLMQFREIFKAHIVVMLVPIILFATTFFLINLGSLLIGVKSGNSNDYKFMKSQVSTSSYLSKSILGNFNKKDIYIYELSNPRLQYRFHISLRVTSINQAENLISVESKVKKYKKESITNFTFPAAIKSLSQLKSQYESFLEQISESKDFILADFYIKGMKQDQIESDEKIVDAYHEAIKRAITTYLYIKILEIEDTTNIQRQKAYESLALFDELIKVTPTAKTIRANINTIPFTIYWDKNKNWNSSGNNGVDVIGVNNKFPLPTLLEFYIGETPYEFQIR